MRRRKRIATIVMLLGLLGSGAILAVGRIKYAWATHRLADLQSKCLSESRPRIVEPLPMATATAQHALQEMFKDPDFVTSSPLDQLNATEKVWSSYDREFAKLDKASKHFAAKKMLDSYVLRKEHLPPLPPGFVLDTDPEGYLKGPIVCDPSDLSASKGLRGVKLEIVEQFDAREEAWNTTWNGVWVLALLLSLPRAWYFLLDRIREIADSIRGHRRAKHRGHRRAK